MYNTLFKMMKAIFTHKVLEIGHVDRLELATIEKNRHGLR